MAENATIEPTAEASTAEATTDTSTATVNGDLIDTNENTPAPPPKETMLRDVYLPDELRKDPTIKNLEDKSVTDLATMMLNGQKAIGADKLVIPGDDAPQEEWTNIYKRLGRPDSPDLYNLKPSEDVPAELHNEELTGEYGKLAFDLGLSAKQTNAIFQWHQGKAVTGRQAMDQVKEQTLDAGREALEKEWGNAFHDKCRLATSVLRNTNGGEEVRLALKEHDLGNDPRILKWLANVIGPTVGEDRLIGLDTAGKNRTNTPEAAKSKIMELKSKPGFSDKYHVEHEAIMNEYTGLMKDAYPEDNVI